MMISMVEGYCVKCRQKREMNEPEKITMKNGKHHGQYITYNSGNKAGSISNYNMGVQTY